MCRKRLSSPRCRSELIDSAWVVIVLAKKCIKKIKTKFNVTLQKGNMVSKQNCIWLSKKYDRLISQLFRLCPMFEFPNSQNCSFVSNSQNHVKHVFFFFFTYFFQFVLTWIVTKVIQSIHTKFIVAFCFGAKISILGKNRKTDHFSAIVLAISQGFRGICVIPYFT